MFEDSGVSPTTAHKSGFGPAFLREAPYFLVVAMALFGVAYTSLTATRITWYWVTLTPLIGGICVISRWRVAGTRQERLELVWRQVLHWLAVLACIEVLFVDDVSRMANTDATSTAVLAVLSLGTFTAGVHSASWRISLVGLFLGLSIPAISWLEQSALLISLGVAAVVAIVLPIVLREKRAA